ncbi:MAG TPA: RHS repeat-associated core domain-containing protein [Rhodanobacteraceae bacterium]|nr:RHS repeat-associated core domain-containing protein [Rhodanobacteraceae bacterium]
MRKGMAFLSSVLALASLCTVVSTHAADTVYYVHTDALGSPVVVTDANRNVVERTQYAPYGQVLNRPEHDGPGYTGHEEDSVTGLANMQQRYGLKVIGRMISVDPMDVDTTTGANFNRYWYANDNPYRFTDPDGRQVGETPVVIAACAASPPCAGAVVAGVTALGVAAKKAGDAGAKYYDHVMQSRQDRAEDGSHQAQPNIQKSEEHTKGARPSTEEKHEKGRSRAAADRHGGEKGDSRRNPYGKRPQGHKGPWPPPPKPKPNGD